MCICATSLYAAPPSSPGERVAVGERSQCGVKQHKLAARDSVLAGRCPAFRCHRMRPPMHLLTRPLRLRPRLLMHPRLRLPIRPLYRPRSHLRIRPPSRQPTRRLMRRACRQLARPLFRPPSRRLFRRPILPPHPLLHLLMRRPRHPHQHRVVLRAQHRPQRRVQHLPMRRAQHRPQHLPMRRLQCRHRRLLPHRRIIRALMQTRTTAGVIAKAPPALRARRRQVMSTRASVLRAIRRRVRTSTMRHRSCMRHCDTHARRL